MSDGRLLFISPTSLSFAECNTFLSLGLFSFPVISSPWQVFHGPGIFNTLVCPSQSRLQFHKIHTMSSLCLHSWTIFTHTWLQLSSLLDSKARIMWPMLPSSAAYRGCNIVALFNHVFTGLLLLRLSFTPNLAVLELGLQAKLVPNSETHQPLSAEVNELMAYTIPRSKL